MINSKTTYILLICTFLNLQLFAQVNKKEAAEKLAKEMANPLSSLINVPLQNNFDFDVGPYKGFRYNLNIQPAIPFKLNKNWNVLSRTIIPITSQSDVIAPNSNQTGLGDILPSFYISPNKISPKFIWGVGPALLIPTATDEALGAKKWAVGPTFIVLKKDKQIIYGMLFNHLWSFAGNGVNDVNGTFFQPFFSYASPTKKGRSYSIASENTQNWENDAFGGQIGVYMAQILKVKKQILQASLGPRIYYGNNEYNPDWGIRLNVSLIYPKKPAENK